jgi:hypothetical protein
MAGTRALPAGVRHFQFGIALLMAHAAAAATPAMWERRAPLPVGNGGFISATIDDEILIAGGTSWRNPRTGLMKIELLSALIPKTTFDPERKKQRLFLERK